MSGKTVDKAASESVSTDATNTVKTETETVAPLTENSSGDVVGSVSQIFSFSKETHDRLLMELGETLHQLQEGFEQELVAPGDIFKMNESFHVIDAITINDFEDRTTGEIKVKHLFKLEFADSRVVMTMQSDARPRRLLAEFFVKARAVGVPVRVGPYKYFAKATGKPQPAFIFVQQAGFMAGPDTQPKQVAA